jgi:hypothetical protein
MSHNKHFSNITSPNKYKTTNAAPNYNEHHKKQAYHKHPNAYIHQQPIFQPPKRRNTQDYHNNSTSNPHDYSNIMPDPNPVKFTKTPSNSTKHTILKRKTYFQDQLLPTKPPSSEPPSHDLTFCLKFTTYRTHTITEASNNTQIGTSRNLNQAELIQRFNNYDYIMVTNINDLTFNQRQFLNFYKTNLHVLTIPNYLFDTSPTFRHAIVSYFSALRNDNNIYRNNHKAPRFTQRAFMAVVPPDINRPHTRSQTRASTDPEATEPVRTTENRVPLHQIHVPEIPVFELPRRSIEQTDTDSSTTTRDHEIHQSTSSLSSTRANQPPPMDNTTNNPLTTPLPPSVSTNTHAVDPTTPPDCRLQFRPATPPSNHSSRRSIPIHSVYPDRPPGISTSPDFDNQVLQINNLSLERGPYINEFRLDAIIRHIETLPDQFFANPSTNTTSADNVSNFAEAILDVLETNLNDCNEDDRTAEDDYNLWQIIQVIEHVATNTFALLPPDRLITLIRSDFFKRLHVFEDQLNTHVIQKGLSLPPSPIRNNKKPSPTPENEPPSLSIPSITDAIQY